MNHRVMYLTNNPSPVGSMFSRIAHVYDLLNHVLSLGIDRNWRRELAKIANPGKNGLSVDLAAGTLDVSLEVLKEEPTAKILAVDFCPAMLMAGIPKIKKNNAEKYIQVCAGNALAIPVKKDLINSITIAFGIRNIKERIIAFQQMLKILKPGGKACILEFGSGKEKIWGGIYNLYLNNLLPNIGKILAKDKTAYNYLAKTIREFPPADKLVEEMAAAGFVDIGYKKLTSGIVCIHWGYKPS